MSSLQSATSATPRTFANPPSSQELSNNLRQIGLNLTICRFDYQNSRAPLAETARRLDQIQASIEVARKVINATPSPDASTVRQFTLLGLNFDRLALRVTCALRQNPIVTAHTAPVLPPPPPAAAAEPYWIRGTTTQRRYAERHPEAASSSRAVAGESLVFFFNCFRNELELRSCNPTQIDHILIRGTHKYQAMLADQSVQQRRMLREAGPADDHSELYVDLRSTDVPFADIDPSQYYRNHLQTAGPAHYPHISFLAENQQTTFRNELRMIRMANNGNFPAGAVIARGTETCAVAFYAPDQIVIFDSHGAPHAGAPDTAYAGVFPSIDSAAQFLARRMPFSRQGPDELLDWNEVLDATFAALQQENPEADERDLEAHAEILARRAIAETRANIQARNRLVISLVKPSPGPSSSGAASGPSPAQATPQQPPPPVRPAQQPTAPTASAATAAATGPRKTSDAVVAPRNPIPARPAPHRPATATVAAIQAPATARASNIYDEMVTALEEMAPRILALRGQDLEAGLLYYSRLNPLQTRIRIIRGIQELERQTPALLRMHQEGGDVAGAIATNPTMQFTIHTEFPGQVPFIINNCTENLKLAFQKAKKEGRLEAFFTKGFCDPAQQKPDGAPYDIEACLEARTDLWMQWAAGIL